MYSNALSGRWAFCLLACAATLGYMPSPNIAVADQPVELPKAVNQFADGLYHGLGDRDNLVYSPASLVTAMGMAYAGSAGDTAAEMAKVLHVTTAPGEIHDLFGKLATRIPGPDSPIFGARCQENKGIGLLVTQVIPAMAADRAGLKVKDVILALNGVPMRTEKDWSEGIDKAGQKLDVQWLSFENGKVMERSIKLGSDYLKTTNAIWAQKGYPLKPQYVDVIKQGFDGKVENVDFKADSDSARKTINSWISQETDGKISDLLSPKSVSSDARLVLTNTVNFKGLWQKPFPKSDDKFDWVNDAKTQQVPVMRLTDSFRYVENDRFQALELAYTDNPMVMVVVLPRKEQAWSEFRKRLALSEIAALRETMQPTRVRVEMPKFSFPQQISMREHLEDKMPAAFSDKADFSGITESDDLQLHDIVHQAFISVDEVGTEASAASAVVIGIKSRADAEFLANRPFVFLLVDRRSGVTWFAGQLYQP